MTALISAGIENYMVSKKTAEVERFQNLYVFTDSTPVLEYDYLGTVSSAMTLSGQYESVRNSLIKSAQKKYPQCDGIILHLVNGGVDKADVIKFK
jgi:hypothetical protein